MGKSQAKKYQRRCRVLTKLKVARLERGLQQADVCRAVKISGARLSEFENGLAPPSPETRAVLAAFFGIEERILFPPTQKKKKSKNPEEPRIVSPSTINRELICLKTCLSKAIEWEKLELDRNPAAKIKKFREPNGKERILTIVETERLLAEASDDLRPVLVVALATGMRKSEILSLRWKDVDFVKGFIHIADSKSGRSRDIPMNSPVFETLHDRSRDREFVFENPETKGRTLDVRTAFKGACRRAEINGLRFHDLRHTAASRMVEKGIDLVTVSKILATPRSR